jgi:ferredoxin/flavodoxin
VYFSPTGTTRTIVRAIGAGCGLPMDEFDFTHLRTAPETPVFTPDDLAIIGLPVYMGRVPFAAAGLLRSLRAEGTPCVVTGVYGNRAFDDFLVELEDILRERGFRPVAAGAFLGEHSITRVLATGRPDADDLALARDFGARIMNKIAGAAPGVPELPLGAIPGNRPYETYTAGKGGKQPPAPAEKPANGPTVDETLCTNCKACVAACPIDNINPRDVRDINPYECIRCHACVRACPAGAIRFLKPGFLRHVRELERDFGAIRKTPTLVL